MRTYRFHVSGSSGPAHFNTVCPVVFGREPGASGAYCHALADDPYVSREHLRLDEAPGGLVRVSNLSRRAIVTLADGTDVQPGAVRAVGVPTTLTVGGTLIDVQRVDDAVEGGWATLGPSVTVMPGMRMTSLASLGETPEPTELARWFEVMVAVLQHAAGSSTFYEETARAVVELVGLDRGLVLLRRGEEWEAIARHDAVSLAATNVEFSRTLLAEVLARKQPVFDKSAVRRPTASLDAVNAVVAAPFLDPSDGRVVGVVYGLRSRPAVPGKSAISPLEAQMVRVLAAAVGAGRAQQSWQSRFEQFTAPELAQFLVQNPDALDVDTREVTILASDVRGSSRLAGELGKDYFKLSRDLMEHLTGRIVEHGGMVVDYAGDGILAMWNAPRDQPDHASKACQAAVEMIGSLPDLNRTWEKAIGGRLALGIGIHTGEAAIGNAGSRWKVKYGPMGDPVNLASRIEGATKHLGVPILLSDATYQAVRGQFPTRRLCQVRLAGIKDPVYVHELYPLEADEEWEARRANYEVALKRYESGKWSQACQLLQQHLGLPSEPGSPPDSPTLTLLSRVVECLKLPSRAPFDPVWEFATK